MENKEMKTLTCIIVALLFIKTLVSVDYSRFKSVDEVKPIRKTKKIIKTVKKEVFHVDATMYYAVKGQCDSDPLVTASMCRINPNKATEHKWIAVSRDLLKRWGGKLDYFDKVRLVGCGVKDGVYTIVDTMNKRFKNKIDILETYGTKLYKYENVKIIRV